MEVAAKIHQWVFRLDNNNSMYQAELYAILNALEWVEANPDRIILIFRGSVADMQATHKIKYHFVLQMKLKLKTHIYHTSLRHFSDHRMATSWLMT